MLRAERCTVHRSEFAPPELCRFFRAISLWAASSHRGPSYTWHDDRLPRLIPGTMPARAQRRWARPHARKGAKERGAGPTPAREQRRCPTPAKEQRRGCVCQTESSDIPRGAAPARGAEEMAARRSQESKEAQAAHGIAPISPELAKMGPMGPGAAFGGKLAHWAMPPLSKKNWIFE